MEVNLKGKIVELKEPVIYDNYKIRQIVVEVLSANYIRYYTIELHNKLCEFELFLDQNIDVDCYVIGGKFIEKSYPKLKAKYIKYDR